MKHRTLLTVVMMASAVALWSWKAVENNPAKEKIHWVTIEQADSLRHAEPRKILIDVYTHWCGWCKKMDATTFSNAELVKYVNENYYAVKLDAEQREPITVGGKTYEYVPDGRRGYHEIAHELLQGKMTYPTIVFLDEHMNMIQPMAGYRDAKTMLPILEYLASEAYRETPWEEWLQAQRVRDGEMEREIER